MSMHRTPTAAVVAAALGLMLLLVLAVTANSPGCEYRCEKGLDRVPREGHKPTSNGCGTSMIKISSKISFTSCCDKHDICYDTCGSVRLRARSQHSSPSLSLILLAAAQSKTQCDKEFRECMLSLCKRRKLGSECEGQANMFMIGVSMGGCGSFLESQKNACECVASKPKSRHHARKTTASSKDDSPVASATATSLDEHSNRDTQ